MKPSQNRSCGSCSLCCKVYPIPVIEKLRGEWCKHYQASAGCTIHQTRPDYCRSFDCIWLQEPSLDDEWKPDTSHMVIALIRSGERWALQVTVDPDYPHAWRQQPYLSQLVQWSAALPPTDRYVVIYCAADAFIVFPDRIEPLGNVGEDRKFSLDFWRENNRWELSFVEL